MNSVKQLWSDNSWLLHRADLKDRAKRTTRKIASCWFDWCYFWCNRVGGNGTLAGVHLPKYEHVKEFAKFRRTAYTRKGIALTSLNAVLAGVYSALIRVSSIDGGDLGRDRKGFFGMFSELKGFLLGLYSDDELDEMKFPRFRCGMEEIQELEHLYWRHERSFSDADAAHFAWVLDYLDLAYDAAFRGSEVLYSSALSDTRKLVAPWRRKHVPVCLWDCKVRGEYIVVSFRHMKNKSSYKKNWVTVTSQRVISRILVRHGCNSLREFHRLCSSQSRRKPVPLLFSPDDSSRFVPMEKARKWLKAFLQRVTPESSPLRQINLHSPRAGFATNMAKKGVCMRTIMYHGKSQSEILYVVKIFAVSTFLSTAPPLGSGLGWAIYVSLQLLR